MISCPTMDCIFEIPVRLAVLRVGLVVQISFLRPGRDRVGAHLLGSVSISLRRDDPRDGFPQT